MKARHLHDVHEPRPRCWDDDRLIEKGGQFYWPAGTIEDHPQAYMLVQMGVAEPADEECELRAKMSVEQMAIAQRHAQALAKGIQPQDYGRFFSGELAGYNPDGSEIPGPNHIPEAYDGPLELPPSYED